MFVHARGGPGDLAEGRRLLHEGDAEKLVDMRELELLWEQITAGCVGATTVHAANYPPALRPNSSRDDTCNLMHMRDQIRLKGRAMLAEAAVGPTDALRKARLAMALLDKRVRPAMHSTSFGAMLRISDPRLPHPAPPAASPAASPPVPPPAGAANLLLVLLHLLLVWLRDRSVAHQLRVCGAPFVGARRARLASYWQQDDDASGGQRYGGGSVRAGFAPSEAPLEGAGSPKHDQQVPFKGN